MPELNRELLPQIIKQNKDIEHEVNKLIKLYLQNMHFKGWPILEGAKKWIESNHFLIQAPIKDSSLGGFILFRGKKNVCYINTWQPRIYQNFVLLHELYHTISKNIETETLHLIELSQESEMQDSDLIERKADYFASLLLLEADDVINFYNEIKDEPFETLIFETMSRFSAPYKAVLLRLYELDRIDIDVLYEYFDTKFELESEFKKLGLDPYTVQRSLVVKFDDLEEKMKEMALPEIAQEKNLETFQSVMAYFSKM